LVGLLGREQCGLERIEVFGDVAEFDHVPPVGAEAGDRVGRVGEVCAAIDRDLVVVEHHDQVPEPEVTCHRCCFVTDAFHQAAVAGHDVGAVIDGVSTEAGAEVGLSNGHADAVGDALAERSGGDLDAGGVADLGVARRR